MLLNLALLCHSRPVLCRSTLGEFSFSFKQSTGYWCSNFRSAISSRDRGMVHFLLSQLFFVYILFFVYLHLRSSYSENLLMH